MRRKPKTNVNFVKDLMEFGSPMMQAFVIEAIRKYSELTLADGPWKSETLVSQDAWKDCADVALKAIEERFK